MSKSEPKQQQQKTTKIKIRGHSLDPIPIGNSNENSISLITVRLAPERLNLCKRTFPIYALVEKKKDNLAGITFFQTVIITLNTIYNFC